MYYLMKIPFFFLLNRVKLKLNVFYADNGKERLYTRERFDENI